MQNIKKIEASISFNNRMNAILYAVRSKLMRTILLFIDFVSITLKQYFYAKMWTMCVVHILSSTSVKCLYHARYLLSQWVRQLRVKYFLPSVQVHREKADNKVASKIIRLKGFAAPTIVYQNIKSYIAPDYINSRNCWKFYIVIVMLRLLQYQEQMLSPAGRECRPRNSPEEAQLPLRRWYTGCQRCRARRLTPWLCGKPTHEWPVH